MFIPLPFVRYGGVRKKEKGREKKRERGKNTTTVNIKMNSAVKLCNRHENTQRKV